MIWSPNIVKAALNVLHVTGLDHVCAPMTRGAGVIFMLHHVRPDTIASFAPNRILAITPDFLEVVLQRVTAQGFDIVSLDEAIDRIGTGLGPRSSRPFVCFTFDDGYRDNRDYAYPIFDRYDAPFTIYIPSDFADHRGRLWWLTLEDVVQAADRLSVDMAGLPHQFDCGTPQAKAAAFNTIYWWLRTLPDGGVHAVIDDLAAPFGIDPMARGRELLMDWDEIRTLAVDPRVTIGAHTVSHVALAKLSEAEARREMAESVARIEAQLDRPCRHFSYPYGDIDSAGEREYLLAGELGLASAVTTGKGVIRVRGSNRLHALNRLSLNGDYQDDRYLKVLLSGLPFAVWSGVSRLRRRRPLTNGISPAT